MIPKTTNRTAPISGPCLEVISRINEDEEFDSSFGLVLILYDVFSTRAEASILAFNEKPCDIERNI
eukprot:scaffold2185_cov76-Cylindrotheca_fusiformis.AAC.2